MKQKRKPRKRVRRNIGDQMFEAICFGDTDFPEPELDDWMAGCGSSAGKTLKEIA